MYERVTAVINKTGLHARPASDFVKTAAKFQSKIKVFNGERPEERVNAKSIAMLLTLGLGQGKKVGVAAEGEDEQAAVDTLIELIDSGFGE